MLPVFKPRFQALPGDALLEALSPDRKPAVHDCLTQSFANLRLTGQSPGAWVTSKAW